jgi:hypothetical protein
MRILGFVGIALGWVLLLFFSSVSADGFSGRSVANLHMMIISVSMILTGGVLVVSGTIKSCHDNYIGTSANWTSSGDSQLNKTSEKMMNSMNNLPFGR